MTIENHEPNALDVLIGARIRAARKLLGISQEVLAQQCGVTFQQVQKYEKGVNRVSFSRLVGICRAMKLPLADLVQGLDAPDASPNLRQDLARRLLDESYEVQNLVGGLASLPPAAREEVLRLAWQLVGSVRAVLDLPPLAVRTREVA